MKQNHWAQACDIITRLVIVPQQNNRWHESLFDVRDRHAALVGWKDKSADAYALIRSIHKDMGMNAAGLGDWQDVSVIH
jgi:hypothetical protein